MKVEISDEDRERWRAEAREKYRRDQYQYMKDAYIDGYVEGLALAKAEEEGKMIRTLEIARELLQLAYPLDDIIKITHLSRQEVEVLQNTQ